MDRGRWPERRSVVHFCAEALMNGQRIVITRRAEQVAELAELIAAAGGVPLAFPTIALEALSPEPLLAALQEPVDWLLFTSSNGVRFFVEMVESAGISLPPTTRMAASGSSTAATLQQHGLPVTCVPDEFVGEALVAALGNVSGLRLLLPRARLGREVVAEQLRQRGATVADIPLYDTVLARPEAGALARLAAGFDAVTFTSPSTVHNFLALYPEPLPQGVVYAGIGPITRAAAHNAAAGLTPLLIPGDLGTPPAYTLAGLVAVLAAHFGKA